MLCLHFCSTCGISAWCWTRWIRTITHGASARRSTLELWSNVARLAGFEPATFRFVAGCAAPLRHSLILGMGGWVCGRMGVLLTRQHDGSHTPSPIQRRHLSSPCAESGSRTHNPRLPKPVLYPIKLFPHVSSLVLVGTPGGIRTHTVVFLKHVPPTGWATDALNGIDLQPRRESNPQSPR